MERTPVVSLLLPPRSLLVFEAEAYELLLHTVRASHEDIPTPVTQRLDLADTLSISACMQSESAIAASPQHFDEAQTLSRSRRVSLTIRRVKSVKYLDDL